MELEEIIKKIQFAMDAVSNIPEPFKVKAFEIVLSKSLDEVPKEDTSASNVELREKPTNVGDKMEKLTKVATITLEQLKDIFDFKAEEPIFIGRVEGNEAEKQVQISELMLLVMQEVYEHEWVASSFLWKTLQECGVGSLDNLAAHLSERPDLFRAMGQKRGRKYRLTGPGRTAALELLRRLALP
jgi:hypothetical protein